MWTSSTDLLKSIHEAHSRLCSGDIAVDAAHAEARILSTAAKVMLIQLEHAKTTGRLEQGSDELPAFRVSEGKRK